MGLPPHSWVGGLGRRGQAVYELVVNWWGRGGRNSGRALGTAKPILGRIGAEGWGTPGINGVGDWISLVGLWW